MCRFIKFNYLISFLLCVANISCKDDKAPIEEPEIQGAETPYNQKKHLESVGVEFLGYVDQSKFNELTSLSDYAINTYENYSWGEAEDWAENIYDGLLKEIGSTTETDSYGNIYHYDNYKALILFSNFQSHFVAENGKWVRSDANDLQFQFKDQNNQTCTLKLTTSGSTKNVYVANFQERNGYNFYDRIQLTIGIPEKINLSLTCGNTTMIDCRVNIDLSSISNEKFDFSKSKISLTSTTNLYNGYKLEFNQAYTSSKLSLKQALSANGKSLASITTSSDINDIPSINLDELSPEPDDYDNYNIDNANAKNAYVELDILNKLQIRGEISNVRKYIEYLSEAEESANSESEFKSYLSQANALSNIHLYYNGTSTKQASISLEAFCEEYYHEYWYYEPVFVFYDGSSYSSFEAFFNDSDFKNLIDSFEALIEDYSNNFDY